MTGRRDIFDQAMRQGHSAAWDQRWGEAASAYRKALQEIPDDVGALTSLGLALYQAQQLDEALNAYARAAQLAPRETLAHEKCAEILQRLGRNDQAAAQFVAAADRYLEQRDVVKAIEDWQQAARLTPGQLSVHSRLALAYERTRQSRLAVAEYLTVAHLLQQAGQKDKALQAAQHALQLDPQSADAAQAVKKVRQGIALPETSAAPGRTSPLRPGASQASQQAAEAAASEAGMAAESESLIESAIRKSLSELANILFEAAGGESSAAPVTAGLDALTRGQTSSARQGRPDRARGLQHLGQAVGLHTQGNVGEAIDEYERALAAGLSNPAIHFNLGGLYVERGEADQAAQHLQAIVSHPEYGLAANLALGQVHLEAGQHQDAVRHLLEALRLADVGPASGQRTDELNAAYETLADAFASPDGQADAAKVATNLFDFLSGDGWRARLTQARAHLDASSETPGSVPVAEMMFVAHSDRVVDAITRIDRYLRAGKVGSALEEALLALDHAPTYLPVHMRMAQALRMAGRTEDATRKYEVVAEAYRVRGEATRAAGALEAVLQISPMNVAARTRLIDVLAESGQVDRAMQQYSELAQAYYDLADAEQARETYAQALRLAQRSGQERTYAVAVLHQIADLDQQRLDWRQAVRAYDQIKALDPMDGKARLALIDLYLRMAQPRQAIGELDDYLRRLLEAGQYDAAIALLEELVRARSDEMAFRARLARLYQDRGRKADAIAQLDALGELQLDAGMTQEGAATIRAILDMGPEDPSAYHQLLDQLSA